MQNLIKRTIIVILVIAVAAIFFLLIWLSLPQKGDTVRIDCTWSEISPDFSPEMRDACRRARIPKPITT